jgi:hypothetical protein
MFGAQSVEAQPPGGNGHRMAPPLPPRRIPNQNPVRERWMAMPPEDRQIFKRNAERWMQMDPEERKILRERELIYRQRVKSEMDAALRASGLRLDGEKRQEFEQRYLEERRRMEHQLKQETEAKRQQELPALQEKLKKEFQQQSASPASTAAPSASNSPKK